MNSTEAARYKALSGDVLEFLELAIDAAMHSMGLNLLPPAAIRCPASCGISDTSDSNLSNITLFTSDMVCCVSATSGFKDGLSVIIPLIFRKYSKCRFRVLFIIRQANSSDYVKAK